MRTFMRLSVLSLVSLAFPLLSHGADICGSFSHVEGDVKFVPERGGSQWVSVGLGQEICPGSTVATASTGRASIKFPGGEELHVAPKTRLVISAMESDEAQKKKKALMNLINGKVRANIPPGSYKSSSTQFRIKSETAVAGVRGTQFVMEYSSQSRRSEVVTLRGEVQVGKPTGRGFNFTNPVIVRPGQRTFSTPQAPPSAPIDLPADEVKSIDDTSAASGPVSESGESDSVSSAPDQQSAQESEPKSPDSGEQTNEPVAGTPPSPSETEAREPASTPPPPSMLAPEDLAPPPEFTAPSDLLLNSPVGQQLPPPIVCEFCDDRIVDGPARIKVKVIRGDN